MKPACRYVRHLGAALAAFTAVAAMPVAAEPTALVGATVYDGTGGDAMKDAVILVEDGRIRCIGPAEACTVPDAARRVDLAGRYVTPGLADAHVHFSQTGWLDGRPDGVPLPDLYPYAETAKALKNNPGRWHRSYLCSGITAVFDVGGHPWTTDLPAAAEGDPQAAHVRAAGPLVTHAGRAALNLDDEIYTFLPLQDIADARQSVATLEEMGAQAVKVWYLPPAPDEREALDARMMAVGAAARAAGLPLIVHATQLREAKVALRAGAQMLVHSVQNTLVDEEFLNLARQNEAVYVPTLIVGRNWTRAVAAAGMGLDSAIDDPNGCVDSDLRARIGETETIAERVPDSLTDPRGHFDRFESTGADRARMVVNLRRVHEAGVTVATGTDAGNPLTLHGPSIYAEMEAMQQAGLAPREILVMSTLNGARAMDREDDFGTLETGKIADLVVLKDDPGENVAAFRSLTHVMRAGVLHAQDALAYVQ